jgi:hypothetical protein
MEDKTLSYFVYQPPKSNSFGHGVRGNDIEGNLKKTIDSFVENFDVKPKGKLKTTIEYDGTNEQELALKYNTVTALNSMLKNPLREHTAQFVGFKDSVTWENSDKTILDVLKCIEAQKVNLLPLVNFHISSSLGYGDNTTAYGWITCSIELGRLFVRMRFIIPYSTNDEKAYTLISRLSKSLPFKLKSKHFRRLGPDKKGYGLWKLDEEMTKRIEGHL